MSVATARCEVAIVGSGFAGALLARLLARLGYDVALIERGGHPRFALGESTTPLANLCLERLSRRYDLPDLFALAAYGRWLRALPALRRGRKRGFTFYAHRPGAPYANDAANDARMLVAASPSDEVADSHWLRADVDHHLVRQAIAAGVDYRDRTELVALETGSSGWRLRGRRDGRGVAFLAEVVIDASGAGGFLARHLGIGSALRRVRTRSALLGGHVRGLPPFAEAARAAGAELPPGPYDDDAAAVHHLLDEGWMYQLPFDHGIVSAGFLLTPAGLERLGAVAGAGPEALWAALLARYPTLGAQLGAAEPAAPMIWQRRVQHRMARAVGEGWAVLPHTFAFIDPLFSTGIAWSLLGVERLARLFEEAGKRRRPGRVAFERYGALLAREADRIDLVVAGAYRARRDFALFAAHALLYFATVSFAEVRQRVEDRPEAAWDGFLGIDDPVLAPLPGAAFRRLGRLLRDGRTVTAGERLEFARWVAGAIGPRDVAGLADPERRNLHPVDLEVLLERHALLGLDRGALERALPRLRGTAPRGPGGR